jgi:hypothetical protein
MDQLVEARAVNDAKVAKITAWFDSEVAAVKAEFEREVWGVGRSLCRDRAIEDDQRLRQAREK